MVGGRARRPDDAVVGDDGAPHDRNRGFVAAIGRGSVKQQDAGSHIAAVGGREVDLLDLARSRRHGDGKGVTGGEVRRAVGDCEGQVSGELHPTVATPMDAVRVLDRELAGVGGRLNAVGGSTNEDAFVSSSP